METNRHDIINNMIERVEENIHNFRQGDPDKIDLESIREHSNKLTDMVLKLERTIDADNRNDNFFDTLTTFKEHITELDKFAFSGDNPADARFVNQSAFLTTLTKFGEKLGVLKSRVISR